MKDFKAIFFNINCKVKEALLHRCNYVVQPCCLHSKRTECNFVCLSIWVAWV